MEYSCQCLGESHRFQAKLKGLSQIAWEGHVIIILNSNLKFTPLSPPFLQVSLKTFTSFHSVPSGKIPFQCNMLIPKYKVKLAHSLFKMSTTVVGIFLHLRIRHVFKEFHQFCSAKQVETFVCQQFFEI